MATSFNKYEPLHVRAWGYYWSLTEAHPSDDPFTFYSKAGGIPELFSLFLEGSQDAYGYPVFYTLTQIAHMENVTRSYVKYEVKRNRLTAFMVGGMWAVRSKDYAAWKARRTKRSRKG